VFSSFLKYRTMVKPKNALILDFFLFSSIPPGKCRDSTSNSPRCLSSKFSPNHHQSLHRPTPHNLNTESTIITPKAKAVPIPRRRMKACHRNKGLQSNKHNNFIRMHY
jgi:hypothetical protein